MKIEILYIAKNGKLIYSSILETHAVNHIIFVYETKITRKCHHICLHTVRTLWLEKK